MYFEQMNDIFNDISEKWSCRFFTK